MTAVPRVLLHAGMGKTGSSALQTAFVLNRDRLAAAGVRYPTHASDEVAARGGVTSGNAARLRRWLVPRSDEAATVGAGRLLAAIERQLESGCPTVLYSSEFLYLARPKRLARLRDHLAARGAELDVVVYVRDVVGHAVSSYSQVVKRALFTGSFAEYVDPSTVGGYHLPFDRVLALADLLGPEHVRLLHYDSHRPDLVDRFFREVLGTSPTVPLPARGPVNRSLTAQEIDLMRRLNAVLPDKAAARRASDHLMGREPWGDEAYAPGRDDVQRLEAMFGEDVRRVNDRFFGRPTLSVLGSSARSRAAAAPVPAPTEREALLMEMVTALASPPARHAADPEEAQQQP